MSTPLPHEVILSFMTTDVASPGDLPGVTEAFTMMREYEAEHGNVYAIVGGLLGIIRALEDKLAEEYGIDRETLVRKHVLGMAAGIADEQAGPH